MLLLLHYLSYPPYFCSFFSEQVFISVLQILLQQNIIGILDEKGVFGKGVNI